ncbi:hypothetical protein H6G89_16365 [Oscillatoria sp. FACHB-1407]|uniref:hypothetical protein n=1 Tax=Oscillatoria sp. FACHB-1407 TaxID=2692847 RepID=UPI0016831B2D|nr:hypothetical protein [Oscillatoria sp. FACHB-1407]MBD2462616.1 hypothetical protein [Oscillatoria sp. FACHB-1407]
MAQTLILGELSDSPPPQQSGYGCNSRTTRKSRFAKPMPIGSLVSLQFQPPQSLSRTQDHYIDRLK